MVKGYRLTVLVLVSCILGLLPMQKVWSCYLADPTAVIDLECSNGDYLYACAGTLIVFDGTGSHDNDEGGYTINTYEWTIKQGTTVIAHWGPSSNLITQSYTFNTPGIYTVTLKVVDNDSQWNEKTVTVYVGNPAITDCYVDDGGSDTTGTGTINNPYATIQHAIDMVCSGATIHIAAGTYDEDLRLHGRWDLTLEGPVPTGWCDLSAVVLGWIDIWECEPNCHLKYIEFNSTGKSYGIRCRADDLLVERCRVHSAYNGLYALYADNLEVKESLVYDNTYGLVFGYGTSPIIKNNAVYENSSYGIYFGYEQNTEIINNTVVDNGVYGINKVGTSTPNIYNCILWGNGDDLNNCTANYSCIENTTDASLGTGNITDDPAFVNATTHDYHLQMGSPCIDTGCPPEGPYGEYAIEPDPDGGRVNMGSFGNTLEATVSSLSWTLTMSVSPTGAGTTTPEIGEHQYSDGFTENVAASAGDGWEFDHWTGPVANAQENPTTITMTDDFSVCAYFVEIDPPSNLTATAGNERVDLQWDASTSSSIDHYNIHRSTSNGFTPDITNCINNVSATETTYEDTADLVNGTTYYYKVVAVNDVGDPSLPSNEANATPYFDPPDNLTATAGDEKVTLQWDSSSAADINHYAIHRSISGSGFTPDGSTLIGSVPASYTTYHDTIGLINGTTYYYKVIAIDAENDESSPTNSASATPQDITAPPMPLNLQAFSGDRQVILTWDASKDPDLDHYEVYSSLEEDFDPCILVDTLDDQATSCLVTLYNGNPLTNGTVYYYRLKAYDETPNASASSNQVSVMPQDLEIPQKPIKLTAKASAGCGTIQLTWNTNAEGDIAGYHVYRADNISGPFATPIETGALLDTSYIDLDVPYNSLNPLLYYAVSAYDDDDNESLKAIVAATPIFPVVNRTQNTRYCSLQEAISASLAGDLIEIVPGIYTENLSINKEITLTSSIPSNPSATVIDGDGTGTVITLGSAAAATQIIGLTLRNGSAANGGGIYNDGASPTLSRCTIMGCDATSNGGGVYIAEGTVRLVDCILINNTAIQGGAVSGASGVLELIRCDVNGNVAPNSGGAIQGTSLQLDIRECHFTSNGSSSVTGGAISGCSGQAVYTKFTGNMASSGGALSASAVDLFNCVLAGNMIFSSSGAAMTNCTGDIINCTITNNSPSSVVSGLANCNGVIANSIFYGNGDGTTSELSGCSTPSYCGIRGWSGGGTGNIVLAGSPVQADGYHLLSDSACINAGDNCSAFSEGTTDIDGDQRILSSAMDMGADEAGNIIYVDTLAVGAYDGTSWYDAYAYLQDALAVAEAGDEIWVAQGTYYPDESTTGGDTNNRAASFVLVEDVALYGGFFGSEVNRDERDLEKYTTILSGDIDQNDANGLMGSTNANHVVTGANGAVLDGFRVERGCADNSATYGGGGLLANNTNMQIRNCCFFCNNAGNSRNGGGIYCNSGSLQLVNCLFSGNMCSSGTTSPAYGLGGGIYINGATVDIINCTFSNNLALTASGSGIYNTSTGSLSVQNTILWENISNTETKNQADQLYNASASCQVNYSCVQGWTGSLGGTGNIGSNPMFVEPGGWIGLGVPDSISIEATIRDFHGHNAVYSDTHLPHQYAHADFQKDSDHMNNCSDAVEAGIVGPYGDILGAEGKPVYSLSHEPSSCTTHGQEWFDMWYRDTAGYNLSETQPMCLIRNTDATYGYIYTFEDTTYFPIDDRLLDADADGRDVYLYNSNLYNYTTSGTPGQGTYHNFHFTTELHTTFYWDAGADYFDILGSDDDLFIYLDGYLVLDVGGIHSPRYRKLIIDTDGKVYYCVASPDNSNNPPTWGSPQQVYKENNVNYPLILTAGTHDFDLFFAERNTIYSNLKFSTSLKFDSSFTMGDYHLQSGSPCIDQGNRGYVPCDVARDLDSLPRFVEVPTVGQEGPPAPVDMGAYEYQAAYEPIEVYAGEDRTIPAASVAEVKLSDAFVSGGYEDTLESEWFVDYLPPSGSVTFTPSENMEKPTVLLSIDQAIFDYQDEVTFELGLEGRDGFSSEVDYVYITMMAENLAPRVNAGDTQSSVDGEYTGNILTPVTLNGSVDDDGKPCGGLLNTRWRVISWPEGGAPTDVTFAQTTLSVRNASFPYAVTTQATFARAGVYVVELSGSDGKKSDADTAMVIIGGTNYTPPIVEAGSDYAFPVEATWPATLNLKDLLPQRPFVTDADGPESLTISWSVISDDMAAVAFEEPYPTSLPEPPASPVDINVTFYRPGVHILRLTADDGLYTRSDTVTITLSPLPEVEAGDNKLFVTNSLPIDVELSDAWVREHARPIGNVGIAWEWIDAAGSGAQMSFYNNAIEKPTVKLSDYGTYKLTLTAADPDLPTGSNSRSDSVWIYVLGEVPPQPTTTILAGASGAYNNYTGIGTGGVVYRLKPDDTWEEISPELGGAVLCLCEYKNQIYAAVDKAGELGKDAVYRWDGRLSWTEVGKDKWYKNDILQNPKDVYGLIECGGELYATDYHDIYKYNDTDDSWLYCTSAGVNIVSAYSWQGHGYLGEMSTDYIDRYDPSGNTCIWVQQQSGSCIYDFEGYQSKIYACAYGGLLYSSANGDQSNWNYIGDAGDYHSWEITTYEDLLYVGEGPRLHTYDGSSFSTGPIWEIPDYNYSENVVSMLATDNDLIIGTGLPPTSYISYNYEVGGGGQGEGRIFRYDGTSFTEISEGLFEGTDAKSSGIQCLIQTNNYTIVNPENLSLAITADSEAAELSPLDAEADEVTYSVTYVTTEQSNVNDVMLLVYLPHGVDFDWASHGGAYDADNHYVMWYVGSIPTTGNNSSDPFQLNVKVNDRSVPHGKLKTLWSMENTTWELVKRDATPKVSCWSGEVVYVSQKGTNENGASWETAFTSLAAALAHIAGSGCGYTQIWVAGGEPYILNSELSLIDNVAVYGGFAGRESNLDERDLSANETIINGWGKLEYVVNGADNATLDGFTVTGGSLAGMYCDNSMSDFMVRNCKIVGNCRYGVYGDYDYSSSGGSLEIINCWICDNNIEGDFYDGYGIYLNSFNGTVTIRNSTIVNNYNYNDYYSYYYGGGIYGGVYEDLIIQNTIIWDNGDPANSYDELQAWDGDTIEVSYCCVEDGYTGTGNIGDDPGDAPNFELGDYHLTTDSGCIDMGNNAVIGADETDIDGEPRIVGNYVDIGADEYPPVRVFAGEDRIVALSPATNNVSIKFSDSVLSSISSDIPVSSLTVQWSKIVGPSGYSILPANNVLHPTVVFTQTGLYVFELAVKEGSVVRGRDRVVVRVDLGMTVAVNSLPQYTSSGISLNLQATDFVDVTPDHIVWHGPEGVVFAGDGTSTVSGTPPASSMNVTFPQPNIYQIWAVAYDAVGGYLGQKDIWVPVGPQTINLEAYAIPAAIVWPDHRVMLGASLSGGVSATFRWEVHESAKELVTFGNSTNRETWAEFATPGLYPITLVAEDAWGNILGVAVVEVLVDVPDYSTTIVDAGLDQTIYWPDEKHVLLSGSISGPYDSIEWIDPSDGLIAFGDFDGLFTSATFAQPGEYHINLVAKSGANIVAFDTVVINVTRPQVVVEAGNNQTAIAGEKVNLAGLVLQGSPDSTEWQIPEQGVASYGAVTSLNSWIIFSNPGTYDVGLLAMDETDAVMAFDKITITVEDVQVDAGQDKYINDFPIHDTVGLQGQIHAGTAEVVEWIMPTDASHIAAHGNLYALDTWMRFDQPGLYSFGLAAKNAANEVIGWDTVTVSVYPQGYDAHVTLSSDRYELTLSGNPAQNRFNLTATVSGSYATKVWMISELAGDDRIQIISDGGADPCYTAVVELKKPGSYDVGFVLYDVEGNVVAFDKVCLTAHPAYEGVQITATGPGEIILPATGSITENLIGEVTPSGSYTYEWIDRTGILDSGGKLLNKTSATAQLGFSSTDTDMVGEYNIDFIVREGGDIIGGATIHVAVRSNGYHGVNINAGTDKSILMSPTGIVSTQLGGICLDNASVVQTLKWINLTQETITFDPSDTNVLNPIVTFTSPGEYHIGLMAYDGGSPTPQLLASDEVVINVVSFDDRDVYVSAGPDQTITFLVDAGADLIGEVTGGTYQSVKWLVPSGAHLTATEVLSTTATFDAPGIYTFRLNAYANGDFTDLVGWNTVTVTVAAPQIVVTAEATTDTVTPLEGWSDELSTLFGNPSTISLRVLVAGINDPSGLSYSWKVLSGENGAVAITPATAGDATAEISVEGIYTLLVETRYEGQLIGGDAIPMAFLSGDPIVQTGNYDPVPALEALSLDQASTWCLSGIWTSRVWTCSPSAGVVFNPAQTPGNNNDIHPTVTFPEAGVYTLTLSVEEQGTGRSASESVNIYVNSAMPKVRAGQDKSAVVYGAVPLDGQVFPWYIGTSCEWSVIKFAIGAGEDDVEFTMPINQEQSEVVFAKPGVYELSLTVLQDGTPVDNDSVVITVESYGLPDNYAPEITTFEVTGTPCALYTITVEAEDKDGHLDYIDLLLDGVSLPMDELVVINASPDSIQPAGTTSILEGSADAIKVMQLTYLLDTHTISDGNHILTAYAVDKAGKAVSQDYASTVNTTSCIIHDFMVDPQIATVGNETLHFTAGFGSGSTPYGWELHVQGKSNPVLQGTHTSLVAPYGNLNVSAYDDGDYIAELHVGGEVAKLPFSVALDTSANDFIVEFHPDLVISVENGIPQPGESMYIIREGTFTPEGRVYHPQFQNDISYRLTLTDDNGFYKDITPLPVDGDGQYRGPVGDAVNYGSLGMLDLTTVPDGIYTLTLQGWCQDLYNTAETQVGVQSNLKLGNVKFSQEDLRITAGGYPLTVTRSYDSFKRQSQGDFGYGWLFSLANMDIQLNERRNDMVSWTQRIGDAFRRDVTLTLPDGRRVTFTSSMEGSANSGRYTVNYEAPDDVDATLTAQGNNIVSTWFYGWYWSGYMPEYYNISVDLSLHDFPGYTLTLADGTKYIINRCLYHKQFVPMWSEYEEGEMFGYYYQPCGKPYLSEIQFPNGDRIVFTVDATNGEKPVTTGVAYYPNGETSATNAIDIIYDEEGRIIAVNAPSENGQDPRVSGNTPTVWYQYDNHGNLEKVHKLVDKDETPAKYETITYVYENLIYHARDHYVTEIRDPRGLSPIQYEYDENGKLVATIDARGNRIEISHDMVNNLEEVKDRSGNRTIYYYDAKGNVTRIEKFNASQQRISLMDYVFGNANYPDRPTQVKVALTANPSSDADYSISTTRYDGEGQPVLVIDPMLNATETTYATYGENTGIVTAVTQWQPDNASASFPPEYPGSGSPSNYTKLTTTRNFYNSDGTLLIASCVTTGAEPSLTVHSMTLNYYDGQNKLTDTVNVDVAYFATGGINDMFADGATRSQLKPLASLPDASNHVATTYDYNESASGSADQPYSVSLPHAANQPPVYQQFSKYDVDGKQVESWSEWIDPANPSVERYIFNINTYDGQGRIIQSRRIVDDSNPRGEPYLSDVILSSTIYNSIGQIKVSEGEYVNLPGEAGMLTEYFYDELGNVVETRTYDPDDNLLTVSRTLYDVEGRVSVTVGPYDPAAIDVGDPSTLPVGTENVYDEAGRVVETRRWAGVQILVEGFDADKQAIDRDDPDCVGLRATGWTHEGEEELSYSRTIYDFAGRTQMTITLDEEGYEQPTGYKYDIAGRQICVADATDYELGAGDYELSGGFYKLKQTTLDTLLAADIGNPTYFPTVARTAYVGTRRDSSTDDNGNTTYYFYDDLGRVITTQYPDTVVEEGGSTAVPTYSHVGYDGLGRTEWQSEMTVHSGESGNEITDDEIKSFTYDIAGRLTTVMLPPVDDPCDVPDMGMTVHPVYRYIYDAYGNQAAIIDAKERMTVFVYDYLGRQTAKYMPFVVNSAAIEDVEDVYNALADALGGANPPAVATSLYNKLGQTVKAIDYKDQTTLYKYNKLGQLEDKLYYTTDPVPTIDPDANPTGFYGVTPVESVSYTYDNLGWMETEESDVRGTTTYHYDVEGNLEKAVTPEGTVNYQYNPITGQKTLAEAANDGETVLYAQTAYGYDNLGRLASATDILPSGVIDDLAHSYAYNAVGSRRQMILANNASPWYEYNAMNRLTRVAHHVSPYAGTGTEPTTLNNFAYSLYADGMRATVAETAEEDRTIDYTYDNLNRLKIEQAVKDTTTYGYKAKYTYDLVGNRLERCLEVTSDNSGVPVINYLKTTYAYDPATDRLSSEVHETITGPCAAVMFGDKPIYAYADKTTGERYFQTADGERIGSFKAFWMGLPSKVGRYANVALWSALAAAVLLPTLILMIWRRLKRPEEVALPYRLGTQALSILLAFVMVFGPWEFQQMTQADVEFTNLATADWATADRTITYTYDDNGALESKTTTVTSTSVVEEVVSYGYNLRGRQARVITDNAPGVSNNVVEVTDYTYNDSGIRVQAYRFQVNQDLLGTGSEQTSASNKQTTLYVIDSDNPTGYAQAVAELVYNAADPDPATPSASVRSYTIGDDMIAQTDAPGTPADTQYLLYDGLGSTRQVIDDVQATVDSFSYDAYGMMLGGNPTAPAATNLLYTGEHYDTDASQYYLRARWYDPSNGRFNRVDPYAGNMQDPQSLHKYLYCHANPVNGVDPSGMFLGFSLGGLLLNICIRVMVFWMLYGPAILNTLYYTMLVCGALWAASGLALVLMDWGYLPRDQQGFIEAVNLYSGVGFVLTFMALNLLTATMGDPRQARPAQSVPRLTRDQAVDGNRAPATLPTNRPVAQNPAINAEKDRDVLRLRQQGAIEVRVDQRQVQNLNGNVVQKGINRPDTQGIFNNDPPVHIEYDTRIDALLAHRDRILANDSTARVILKWFDNLGNYTIVP